MGVQTGRRRRDRNLGGQAVARPAVEGLRAGLVKKEAPHITLMDARGREPPQARLPLRQEILELSQRDVEWLSIEQGQLDVAEAVFLGRSATARARRYRFRPRGRCASRTATSATGNAARPARRMPRCHQASGARELADHVGGVRRVMERVEADDAIDAAGPGSGIDRPSTCTNSGAGRAPTTGRRRYSSAAMFNAVAETSTSTTRQPSWVSAAREPAGAAAELEHGVTRSQPQTVQHRRQVHQQTRRFDDGAKRLGEVVVPTAERGEVFLGRAIQHLE